MVHTANVTSRCTLHASPQHPPPPRLRANNIINTAWRIARYDHGVGYKLVASRPIRQGEVMLQVPDSVALSIRSPNTPILTLIPDLSTLLEEGIMELCVVLL